MIVAQNPVIHVDLNLMTDTKDMVLIQENPEETEELSKLRCQDISIEDVAEIQKRKRVRSANYPGLSATASIFSSDTFMRFGIIKNELHNIKRVQLKRVSVGKL